ncbi:hypothetical protein ACIBI7_16810 [Nonomuraea fuscirosea]|uniref:hypothetical protein n=1 Tax=Nonomuraea fuscirosea TaxID=1291556 RepID=UPI0037A049F1
MKQRRVVFVVFDGFQSLDLAGPYEVFHQAGAYTCEILAPAPGLVRTSSGLPPARNAWRRSTPRSPSTATRSSSGTGASGRRPA